ncbi:MAG: hypothetical protein R3E12_16410 [Candidatus Eisenbacteria bacterium]
MLVATAGHCATAVQHARHADRALRHKHAQTGGRGLPAIPNFEERALVWEDLLTFRRNGGLPGHAEMEGKTLFVKFNTGPSGHGSPPAAGAAMALKRAGADDVRVYAFEGEGGLTTGATHETRNSAWGLGRRQPWSTSSTGTTSGSMSTRHPRSSRARRGDWFEPYGWHVTDGRRHGVERGPPHALSECIYADAKNLPRMCWVKTRKGRDYLKYDYASHGAPHKSNSEIYWETKRAFAEKYGVDFAGFGQPSPRIPMNGAAVRTNFRKVVQVMHDDQALVDYLADTLVRIGDSVPQDHQCRLDLRTQSLEGSRLLMSRPIRRRCGRLRGESAPNRAALADLGRVVQQLGTEE